MGKGQGSTNESNRSHGASVDGVMGRSAHTKRSPLHLKRSPQKSSTLMRQAVKKPTPSTSRRPGPTRPESPAVITPHQLMEDREKRAHKIRKSPLISRFSFANPIHIVKKVSPLPVRDHPVAAAPVPQVHHQHTAVVHPEHPRKVTSEDLVSRALSKANSHNAAHHKIHKRGRLATKLGLGRRATAIGASLVAVLLLGAFYAYQNVPNFAMRVAAARAGFEAGIPNYQPSGFSFNSPIKYSPGEVTISFQSNTGDSRVYSLTQRKTSWNSDELLANFVISRDSQYQTFLERDRTVYTFDNGSAAWVDDGIWYELDNSASLTSDQILRIAGSL